MKIRQISCKTALSPSKLPGIDYSLNPYRGCEHNCAYCYAPNVLRIKREKWGDFVDVKINIPLILSKELKMKKPGVVGISTVTDPYQPVEKKFKITRYSLEQLLKHDFPINIQTKSSMVIRDIDIISKFSDVEVMVSIATINDNERKLLEPYSSSIEERLNILKYYSNIGIKVTVFFGPIYPTIKNEELTKILQVFKDYGASEIMIDNFHIRKGVMKSIESALSKNPDLLEIFSKNILKTNNFHPKFSENIKDFSRRNKIKIIDAF
jgi:DNA repair photolyase